jgi:hypothetical protein
VRSFFIFLTCYAAGLNLLLMAMQLALLRRRTPWPRAIGIGVCVWTTLMIAILLLQAFAPIGWRPFLRDWLYFPIAVEMIWNLLFLQPMVLVTILVTLYLRRWKPVDPPEKASAPAL